MFGRRSRYTPRGRGRSRYSRYNSRRQYGRGRQSRFSRFAPRRRYYISGQRY